MRRLAWLMFTGFMLGIAYNKPEPNTVEIDNLYVVETRVIEFEESVDVVVVEAKSGQMYGFKGIEDWCIGDNCILVMDDCGTKSIKDDKIIRTFYRR